MRSARRDARAADGRLMNKQQLLTWQRRGAGEHRVRKGVGERRGEKEASCSSGLSEARRVEMKGRKVGGMCVKRQTLTNAHTDWARPAEDRLVLCSQNERKLCKRSTV